MLPDSILPFGPFHIVVLHLPIGLLFGLWMLEFLTPRGEKKINAPLAWMHTVLLLATTLTIVLGLAYEKYGDYGSELDAHRQSGLLFGGALLLAYLFFWVDTAIRQSFTRLLYIASLTIASAALVITGHLGGELIHGKGFLLKPFQKETAETSITTNPEPVPVPPPATIETAEPESTKPQEKPQPVKEETIIQAEAPPAMTGLKDSKTDQGQQLVALFHAANTAFERNCLSCHGSTRKKGGYRLDTREALYLPGKSKRPPIVAGQPMGSHIYQRMTLPREHEDAMPPIEKDPVPVSDIEAVRDWILAGAYWPSEQEMRAAADTFTAHGNADTNQLIAEISKTGAKAEYNAWGDESVRIDLGVVLPGQLNTALQTLQQFGPELVWLDASNLELPDDFFAELIRFPNLQRLHLDGTNITDGKLAEITHLKKIRYLNLFNTAITDQAAQSLRSMPALHKVYLGNTQFTDSAVETLRGMHPNLQVVHRSPSPILGSTAAQARRR